jgi:acetoacetyl-CoA synthetase
MTRLLWSPDAERAAKSNLARFARSAAEQHGLDPASYAELHRWSVQEPGAFWPALWDFTGIIASQPYQRVVDNFDRFPGASWFPGAKLNFAENLLRYRDEQPALISMLETGERRELSFAELYATTAGVAQWMSGVIKPGDRVAGWLPNTPEAIIAMLATTAAGGVWSSCSPDFGANGALDRFGQIEPRVLIACDGYHYGGKTFSTVDKVLEVAAQIESLEAIVWVNVTGDENHPTTHCTTLRFSTLCEAPENEINFVPRGFSDPLYVMYSSGTTGKPKCIVHSVGGTLIQHLKEQQLHVDLQRDDRLFFFTTCGWMMWNWLVSGLASGATLVLFDGSPLHPAPTALMDLAEQESISVFGVSAKYLSALEKADAAPRESHDLSALRSILSTGSPLTHEGFRYVYEKIKPDVHLASMSGGTDILGCFVMGNPNAPVWEGEIQCAALGMAVEVWDEDGSPVRETKGELVCTQPMPSCPIGFWDDPDHEKFLDAYFRRFPGVWTHGDFAEITEHDGFIIHGRSDAVLNPGGVRIGTAEIYRQVDQFDAVLESICVGQEWDDDTRVILFVVMRPGHTLDDALAQALRQRIREKASPRHMPAKIIAVPDIPRTLSGKIVELAVREIIHGRPVQNTSALANPEALAHFAGLPELGA